MKEILNDKLTKLSDDFQDLHNFLEKELKKNFEFVTYYSGYKYKIDIYCNDSNFRTCYVCISNPIFEIYVWGATGNQLDKLIEFCQDVRWE